MGFKLPGLWIRLPPGVFLNSKTLNVEQNNVKRYIIIHC